MTNQLNGYFDQYPDLLAAGTNVQFSCKYTQADKPQLRLDFCFLRQIGGDIQGFLKFLSKQDVPYAELIKSLDGLDLNRFTGAILTIRHVLGTFKLYLLGDKTYNDQVFKVAPWVNPDLLTACQSIPGVPTTAFGFELAPGLLRYHSYLFYQKLNMFQGHSLQEAWPQELSPDIIANLDLICLGWKSDGLRYLYFFDAPNQNLQQTIAQFKLNGFNPVDLNVMGCPAYMFGAPYDQFVSRTLTEYNLYYCVDKR